MSILNSPQSEWELLSHNNSEQKLIIIFVFNCSTENSLKIGNIWMTTILPVIN